MIRVGAGPELRIARWPLGQQVTRFQQALDRDTMRGTIYEKRPLIYREFETGSQDCLEEHRGIATEYR